MTWEEVLLVLLVLPLGAALHDWTIHNGTPLRFSEGKPKIKKKGGRSALPSKKKKV